MGLGYYPGYLALGSAWVDIPRKEINTCLVSKVFEAFGDLESHIDDLCKKE